MARVAYTDLIVSFTIGANTNPNTTNVPLLITNLYRQAFHERNATYTTGTDTIIDSEECWSIIMAEASRIVNEWSLAVKNGSETKFPSLMLSKEAAGKIRNMVAEECGRVDNVQLWNEETDYQ